MFIIGCDFHTRYQQIAMEGGLPFAPFAKVGCRMISCADLGGSSTRAHVAVRFLGTNSNVLSGLPKGSYLKLPKGSYLKLLGSRR